MRFLRKVRDLFDLINNLLLWLAGLLLLITLFSVCYEVATRYFFHRPTIWSMEISEHMLAWITFLGAAWLLEKEGHVKIDFLLLRLKPRIQTIINIVTSIFCAFGCLIFTWYSVKAVLDQLSRGLTFSTALALPVWPILLIIPLSFFLLFIQFLRRAYRYLDMGVNSRNDRTGIITP